VYLRTLATFVIGVVFRTRTLATANKWPGGVVDPVEIFLSSSSITVQNLATASHTVRAHVGVANFWYGAPSFSIGCGWLPRNTLLPHVLPRQI